MSTPNEGLLPQKVRADFPLLTKKVRGKSIVYLDSAATGLKPWPVIERISHFYSYETANVHRGAHFLADQATRYFEESRSRVQKFLNAQESEEIIFTKGTTESINLVAQTWAKKNLKSGDEVLISIMEHHANIVPWQMICEEKGAKVVAISINEQGELLEEDFQKKINSKTKLVAITHCSNVLGTVNNLKFIIEKAHKAGALVLVDGAQMVSFQHVDVQDLNCDFYAFSGHKIFGPFGVGVLYGKRKLLENMPPYQGGGSMINHVTIEKTTYNDLPFKFEAGTPNIEAVIALAPALEYLEGLGWENIAKHDLALINYATKKILEIPGVKIIGQAKNKAAILSFVIEGTHPSDVGQILDQENVAVRVGHHCTQPLMDYYKISGTVRASFSIYNNFQDVDAFIKALIKAKEMLL